MRCDFCRYNQSIDTDSSRLYYCSVWGVEYAPAEILIQPTKETSGCTITVKEVEKLEKLNNGCDFLTNVWIDHEETSSEKEKREAALEKLKKDRREYLEKLIPKLKARAKKAKGKKQGDAAKD